MKRHIIIALVLGSLGSLNAQTFMQAMYPNLPFDTVNFEHEYTSQEMIATADNGMLLLGNDDNAGYICKTDESGNQLWARRLTAPNNADGDTVQLFLMRGLETSDGEILLSMRTGGTLLQPPVLALAKFSAAGNLIWAQRFPGFSLLAESMVEVDDRILMIGNENFGGQNVATVLELDDQGEIINGRRCIFPFWFTSLSMDGAIYRDSKFLFWDSFFEGPGGPNQNNFSTMVTEYDFNTNSFSHVYQTEELTSSIFAQRIIYDIVLDEDGSRYISYQHQGNFLLTRFNPGGSEAWTYDISAPGHLLLDDATVYVLSSSTDPAIAALKKYDKQNGAWKGAFAYPSFSNSFNLGEPIITDDAAIYWPAISRDPVFGPLPITPVSIIKTDTLGNISDCMPQEICTVDTAFAEAAGFSPFEPLNEQDAPQPNASSFGLLTEAVNFVITPFCVPANEEELSAEFELPSPACPGDSIQVFPTEIDPQLSASEWTAQMALNTMSTLDTAIFQFETSGNFDIQHILIVEGCRDTVSKSIEILEGPVFDLGADTAFCQGDSLLLQSGLSASINELEWQNGSTEADLLIDAPGTYELIAIGTSGCEYSDEISISAIPLPEFSLGEDTIICKGTVIALQPDNAPDNTLFRWSTGAQSSAINVGESGSYTLTLTDTLTSCSATDTTEVSVRPFPAFDFQPADTVFCPGVPLFLEARSLAGADLTFTWPDGSTASQFEVPAAGSYELLASDGPCQDTLGFELPAGECLAPMYAPTAFSPNDDGRNDIFQVYGPDIQVVRLQIYNRWGGLIYEGADTNARWGGVIEGETAKPGVYVYVVEYLNLLSLEVEQQSGEIILLR